MGKKNKKINHVFKVAGAKSLKAKCKAKPVTGQLKNVSFSISNKTNVIQMKLNLFLQIHVKNKILQMDKQLLNIQDHIRQTKPPQDTKPSSAKSEKMAKHFCEKSGQKEIQENSQATVKNLEVLKL